MKDAQQTADCLINEFNDNALYDIATSILWYLQGNGYCIWQTYTIDDIEACEGKRPSKERIRELSDSLQCFENIRF